LFFKVSKQEAQVKARGFVERNLSYFLTRKLFISTFEPNSSNFMPKKPAWGFVFLACFSVI
jgi:hypothetical protein